jgi:hypothetical protein
MPKLRAQIEALRSSQYAAPARLPVRQRASDASLLGQGPIACGVCEQRFDSEVGNGALATAP